MNIKCEVIRDLLPLYVDEVASDESCALIEEHLEECQRCREYCQRLREDLPGGDEPDFADETASLRKIKRRINRNRILVVMVTLAFAIVVFAFLSTQGLTEYSGSLEENLSYELPTGYALSEKANNDEDNRHFVRETEDKYETIWLSYYGLESATDFSEDETVQIDEDTYVEIAAFDWSHNHDNTLYCTIQHEDEYYELRYQCQIKKQDEYYDSCSLEQKEEIISFIRTFDYHRPGNAAGGNVLQRLYHNFGIAGCIILALTVLIFAGFPIAIGISSALDSGKPSGPADTVIRSRDLHESMNREREAQGEASIPSINNVQGVSSNNLARRDHSWNSVPDFFIKLFQKKDDKK